MSLSNLLDSLLGIEEDYLFSDKPFSIVFKGSNGEYYTISSVELDEESNAVVLKADPQSHTP